MGETNFQPRKFPQSGLKEKDGEKETMVITMDSYALQTPPRVAHASRLGQLIKPFSEKREPKRSAAIFSFVYFCDFPYQLKMGGHGEQKSENS